MSKKPVLLCIMDGFGWTPNETYGNAVAAANKPFIDSLMAKYPMTTIDASGMAVGLPDGQMGNSEVGHTNMGAGRIVYQQLTLITKSIRDGEMLKNPVLVKNMKAAIDAGKAIHLMGLVGTGGVHSHADHWFGVLEMAKHMGAKEVYLHCITDGRDTDPHSGKGFLADLQAKLDELGIGKIASVSGRYYAMDRDNNWDREEKAYAAFVYGEGNHAANAQEAIEASYAADKTDEFVLPCVTCEGGRVQDGDTVIFMNFRPDRARQMTRIFCDDAFTGFERRGGRKQVHYVCMAEYDATMPNCEVAYPPVELKNVLGQYLSENGKTQGQTENALIPVQSFLIIGNLSGKLLLMAGQLDTTNYMDHNAYANSHNNNLTNSVFGNNPMLPLTDNSLGFHFAWQPTTSFYVMGATAANNMTQNHNPFRNLNSDNWTNVH